VEINAPFINMNIVQRNANLDGFLKKTFDGSNMAVRYVESDMPVDAISQFAQVARKKQSKIGIVIVPRATQEEKEYLQELFQEPVRTFIFSYRDICAKAFNIEDIIYDRQIIFNNSALADQFTVT
jgi:NADH/NAD ratio-sensing transcriptional regulator Rex